MLFLGINAFTKGYAFQFPEVKQREDSTTLQQFAKVDEEVTELGKSVYSADDMNILVEAMDVIISVENLLRFYPDGQVQAAAHMVYEKNKARNYWVDPDEEEVLNERV